MEPLNQARAILVAQRLELWSVICSIINLYYNSPKHRIYLAISWEPRLCQQLEHSTLFSLLLMEPLNQARAILVAQLLELCPVISSIIGLYYNSPTNSIYLTISWEPRLCWKVAHSILLSLLLMQPLNQARASLAAQLLELCPVICSIINLYYNSPTNRIYLPISWAPFLGNQDFVCSWHILYCSLCFQWSQRTKPELFCGLTSWSYGLLYVVALLVFTPILPNIAFISPFLGNQDYVWS
jgi:hypothetical protein